MIRLSLLGPASCRSDTGEEFAGVLRSRKRLAVLAYLAVQEPPGLHRRDTLIGLLWPESDQKRARGALRQALRHLRSELGDVIVTRGTEEVGLDWDRFECDVQTGRRLLDSGEAEEALALYRGDLLDGFYLSGVPAFEDWLGRERRKLRRRVADAAWGLAGAAEETGAAVEWARRAAALSPYDEAALRRLMAFLDGRGDTLGALRSFERFRDRVQEEFGGGPTSGTQALADRLRSATRAAGVERESGDAAVGTVRSPRLAGPGALGAPTAAGPDARSAEAPATTPEPAGIPRRRRRLLVAVGGLAILAAAGLAQSRLVPRAPALRLAHHEPVTADEGLELMAAISPRGDRIAYVGGDVGARQIFVRRAGGGAAIPITTTPGDHLAPTWHPDGERLAFVTERNGAFELRSAAATGGGSTVLFAVPPGIFLAGPTWSPGGDSIAFKADRTLTILSVLSGDTTHVTVAESAHSLAWSPDGRWIAFVSENSEFTQGTNRAPSAVWIASVATGDTVAVTTSEHTNQSPSWGPGAERLWFVSDRDGSMGVYAVELGADARPRGEPARVAGIPDVRGLSLSADGRRIAYPRLEADWDIWTLDVPADSAPANLARGTPLTRGHQSIETLSLSRDGAWIAYDSDVAGNQDLYRIRVDGRDSARLTRHPGDDFGAAWSPAGDELAYYAFRDGNRDLHLVDVQGLRERPLRVTPDTEAFPDWSPSGEALLFQMNPADASVEATRLHVVRRSSDGTWGEPRPLTDDGPGVQSYAGRWSPDGGRIAFLRRRTGEPLELWIRSVADGREWRLAGGGWISGRLAWDREGEHVYFAARREGASGIWRVPARGGVPRLIAREPDRDFGRFAFDTDGERIFYTRLEHHDADIWIADVVDGGAP